MLAMGILFSTITSELFFAMMMVGFLGALLAQRFVFRNAELKSEVVTGLILISTALLMMLTRTQQIVHFAAPAFVLSRHCQRGTSQSTFLLGWESGIAWGLGLGYALFYAQPQQGLITALVLTVASLVIYNFSHNWFASHKNR